MTTPHTTLAPLIKTTDAMALGRFTRPPMLIKDILPAKSITVIAGPTYSRKTFFALEAAKAVAFGTPFMGHWKVESPGNVLFLEQDAPAYDTGRAFWAMLRADKALFDRLRGDEDPFHQPHKALQFAWHQGLDLQDGLSWQRIVKTANAMWTPAGLYNGTEHGQSGCRLIVMDTMRSHHTGEENDSTAMSAVMARLNRIRTATDAAILLIHHVSRGNDTLRGSTAIEGAVDTIYRITPNRRTETSRVRIDKARAIQPPEFAFTVSTTEKAGLVMGKKVRVADAPREAAATIANLPRFADFVAWITEREGASLQEAREQFEVSPRTIDRWFANLRTSNEWRRESFTHNGTEQIRYTPRDEA